MIVQNWKRRALWRTHSVVCRRCKAKAESLRQTDGDAIDDIFIVYVFSDSPLDCLFFNKEGIYGCLKKS